MNEPVGSVIHSPKQSKHAPKKKSGKKSTVLEWIRAGYQFPGKPAPRGAQ